MDHLCPDRGTPLTEGSDRGARTLTCRSCSGHLYGLAPFERMLTDGVGARVWTGSASGSPSGPCPYCTGPMHRPDEDPDAPSALAVCRLCQEIWVPASAANWMATHAAVGPDAPSAAAPPTPADCVNCGAPFQPDEDGRCHWCHTQISSPQPVVLFMQAPEPAPSGGFRLI